jgi:dCTP deaminase
MIVNGGALLKAAPVSPMLAEKRRAYGVSYGLSEAGLDIRIRESVVLHPFRRFTLASSLESFDVPDDLVGIVHDKSTWIRQGLVVGNTVVEPGWKGESLTLELFYFGWWPLRVPAGAGIAQVIFHQTAERRPYAGKYQHAPEGITKAILEPDA